jgi:ADP-ribosylglycohydrolase
MPYRHIPNLAEGAEWHVELAQARDEGREMSSVESAFQQLADLPEQEQLEKAALLMDTVQTLPLRTGYMYDEPDEYDMILKARPALSAEKRNETNCVPLSREDLYDKIHGAWLGRCAGCLLGKPVEGWMRGRITGFLKASGNYPIRSYMSSNQTDDIRKEFDIEDTYGTTGVPVPFINNTDCMARDDDTDYSILSVLLLEMYGKSFTGYQLLEFWLSKFPILSLWTAERAAYRNAVNCIEPPQSARYRNPYREWIGAQIRTDVYGYVSPGRPEDAARMAYADASVSHVKNGIYSAMWVAAMTACAAVDNDAGSVIRSALLQIPEKSRLTEAVHTVLEWRKQGVTAEQALDNIHERYDEAVRHDWCHAVSNSMIVAIALLWGHNDFDTTLHLAVSAGFDTDCNAATAGSIAGMIAGARNLPEKWTKPLHDTISSGIAQTVPFSIEDLARRCAELI